MKSRRRISPLVALVLAVSSSLSLGATVKADFDKSADFSKHRSFAFRKGTDAPTPFAQERIVNAIAGQLALRGLARAEDKADLLVYTHVQIGSEQRMDVTNYGYGGYYGWRGWGGGWGTTSVNVYEIATGTLMVDMVDQAKGEIVWRGIATDTLLMNPTPEKSEKRINKAVAKLFKKYPVPASKK